MLNTQVRLLAYENNVAVTLWDSGTTCYAQHRVASMATGAWLAACCTHAHQVINVPLPHL